VREVWTILLLQGACNLVAVIYGVGYGWITISDLLDAETRRLLLWMTLGVTAASYGLGLPVLWLICRPVARVLDALRTGGAPPEATPQVARRRALELPRLLGWTSVSIWCAGALLVLGLLAVLPIPLETSTVFRLIIVTLVMGAISSTFVLYIVEEVTRRRVVPILVPDGRVTRVPGVRPASIVGKLAVLIFTACLVPVILLSSAAIGGYASPISIAYVGTAFFFLGALQGLFINRSINRPVSVLAREMEKVAAGDLEARAPVVSADPPGRLAEGFNEMVAGLREGVFVRETFGRYVDPAVAAEILGGKVDLGGEERIATILFSDIRGFTSLCEGLPAPEVVRLLNRYLDAMVDVLVAHGATIDKFVGDAVVATFGVPVGRPDDAERAIRAALGMLDRLDALNAEATATGDPVFDIGIGLHTGEVVAGNVGSARKMEYTVIGDAVNTAARIEQLNKEMGSRLLVSEVTHAAAATVFLDESVVARRLDPVAVRGKREALVVYAVSVEASALPGATTGA
jgi:adenylate cyclase